MKFPKMILFDYGHTLLYEPGWDTVKGNIALMNYVTKNPRNYSLEDVVERAELIFGVHMEAIRKNGYEICARVAHKTLYESLGMEFSLSPLEMETVFWNGASAGARMPDADILLDYLHKNGIRSAVISNLIWSGEALRERLNRLLPDNRFEFVMTSSDYFLRKPNRLLFEIALEKAGLCADEVWFCGDHPQKDVEGASAVGIFPVWYENDTDDRPTKPTSGGSPRCEHLHIHEWRELILELENLKCR